MGYHIQQNGVIYLWILFYFKIVSNMPKVQNSTSIEKETTVHSDFTIAPASIQEILSIVHKMKNSNSQE